MVSDITSGVLVYLEYSGLGPVYIRFFYCGILLRDGKYGGSKIPAVKFEIIFRNYFMPLIRTLI